MLHTFKQSIWSCQLWYLVMTVMMIMRTMMMMMMMTNYHVVHINDGTSWNVESWWRAGEAELSSISFSPLCSFAFFHYVAPLCSSILLSISKLCSSTMSFSTPHYVCSPSFSHEYIPEHCTCTLLCSKECSQDVCSVIIHVYVHKCTLPHCVKKRGGSM